MGEKLPPALDASRLPEHVAVIMDGNGRYAKQKGQPRAFGHQRGTKTAKQTITTANDWGIKYLTLYAFSEQNWQRPSLEKSAIMQLLKIYAKNELPEMMAKNMRLRTIGDISKIPKATRAELENSIAQTKNNTGLQLTLALSYGGREEILRAVNRLLDDRDRLPEQIGDSDFSSYLDTAGMPDPDLIIRTSGEMRMSNYLLWQSAYSEFYVTDTLWPEFDKPAFLAALLDFQNRRRRFGGIVDHLGGEAKP